MGYYPFEHKAGRAGVGRAGRVLGAGDLGRWVRERWASEAQARGTGDTTRRGARAALRHDSLALRHGRLGGHDTATARVWACLRALGRAGWAVCVHTMHLTSF